MKVTKPKEFYLTVKVYLEYHWVKPILAMPAFWEHLALQPKPYLWFPRIITYLLIQFCYHLFDIDINTEWTKK